MSEAKRLAGEKAIEFVEDGMIVGVGTGSTVAYFIDALAEIKGRIEGAVASAEGCSAGATPDQHIGCRQGHLGRRILDSQSRDAVSDQTAALERLPVSAGLQWRGQIHHPPVQQRGRISPRQTRDQRRQEQARRHQRRGWIAGQAQNQLLACPAEPNRLAGLDGHLGEDQLQPEGGEHRAGVVLLPDGRAARDHHQIGLAEGKASGGFKCLGRVGHAVSRYQGSAGGNNAAPVTAAVAAVDVINVLLGRARREDNIHGARPFSGARLEHVTGA